MPQATASLRLTGAKARHRELTQAVYDIGDEVAEYIEHISQAVADWDVELVEDCLDEFDDIAIEARLDARTTLAELAGLRQALTSGLHSGTLSAGQPAPTPTHQQPARLSATTLINDYPLPATVPVEELATQLTNRTNAVIEHLDACADWISDTASLAAVDIDSVSLTLALSKVRELVTDSATGWLHAVAARDKAFVRAQRGHNPPRFLFERAATDDVVRRVQQKLAAARNTPQN